MSALALATAWRIVFLALSAPVVGAALMTLIGRVTGGSWPAAERPARLLPLVAAGGLLVGVAQAATPVPAHLALWLHPGFVAARAVAVTLGLWVAVRRRPSVTVAAAALALYALVVTPLASDWLLGGVPGHPVSAAGMMLVCWQVAAACALPLATGRGGERERQDLARLMIAAALGLGYLLFVDYLIVWFGNLPAQVGFYVERGDGLAPLPLVAALVLGWAAPVTLLAGGGERGRRLAGAAVLAALVLVDLWWVAAGTLASGLALIVVAGAALVGWRRGAHG